MHEARSSRWLPVLWLAACAHPRPSPEAPEVADGAANKAAEASPIVIDRFSAAAGRLQVRTASNGLPGPGQPVDFDRPPFITQSWGPGGEIIRYYNFDVQPTTPARMYVFYVGEQELPAQRRVVDVIPGQPGYSDFFRVVRVRVPASYVPDELRDAAAIRRSGFELVDTSQLVNRPIVPRGSQARERLPGATTELETGWYRGQEVQWFRFDEARLIAGPGEPVPTSPISVTFNRNPDQPGGGPPSGFRLEPGTRQTHNVASSLPGDVDYSPLWAVSIYDNAAFPSVFNEATVRAAPFKARDVATVNCPIVFVGAR
jgi:hypothetical protein